LGSQLDPLPLSRVGSQSVPPSLNFPQLDFVKPSSGFHLVTWECVTNNVVERVEEFINLMELMMNPKVFKRLPKTPIGLM
jgi:predicted RNA-binding protein with PUA-like domain